MERVLHTKNDVASDSVKIAGMMDLMRVQGRWAAAARLAWVRVALTTPTDVTGGAPLAKVRLHVMGGRAWITDVSPL